LVDCDMRDGEVKIKLVIIKVKVEFFRIKDRLVYTNFYTPT